MNLNEAKALAIELMDQHNLLDKGWYFMYDTSKRCFGRCWYFKKMISLSVYLTDLNDYQTVKNTILHEIAHAIAGHKNGHNSEWKKVAKSIGCDGERCYNTDTINQVEGKYKAICIKCDKVFHKYRMTKKSHSCGNCSGGKYNPTYKLTWIKV